MNASVSYSLIYIKYIKFLDSAKHTYRLNLVFQDGRFFAHWLKMQSTGSHPIAGFESADTAEHAEAQALDAMYNHLTYMLRIERIARA